MDYLQESARKVLKNRFTGANESYIDMSGYSRESRGNLIKEYYKKPKIMEYIIYKMFLQTRKRSKWNRIDKNWKPRY